MTAKSVLAVGSSLNSVVIFQGVTLERYYMLVAQLQYIVNCVKINTRTLKIRTQLRTAPNILN